jgi:alkylation response protein AidB-like acyl-CoA dehydrogenase
MSDVPSLLYTDVEDGLRDAVRGLVGDRSPLESVLARTDDKDPFGPEPQRVWHSLAAEIGVAGLAVAEADGGAGASWREVAVVLEELGRGVVDVPFLTSAVLATAFAQELGAGPLLAGLAAGETIAAIVAPWGTPLTAPGGLSTDGTTVTGTVAGVAGAAEATHLLVVVDDRALLVEAAAAVVTPVPSLDMTRRIADVELVSAPATVLADGVADALHRTADLGTALLASEQLGIAERTLESTVEYLGTRRQFGRVVGSYQALKHRLADLWTEVAQARAVARYAAACAAAQNGPLAADLPIAASLAQAVCGRVAVHAAEECVQLHGGIGFAWEHPAHLFLKRARVDALALGTPAWHRHRIARLTDLVEVSR